MQLAGLFTRLRADVAGNALPNINIAVATHGQISVKI